MKKLKILSNYNKKTKTFKIIIPITILILITSILFLILFFRNDKSKVDEMNFTTNKGNVIYTEYKDLGKFNIKIPKDFEIMNEDILDLKYPTDNKPELVYTNQDASINIAFNLNGVHFNGEDISKTVELIKLSFIKMGYLVTPSNFEVDGTKIYTLAFNTQAINAVIYNYMVIFPIKDQLTIINFNCTDELADEWSDVGEFIIKSIKIK